MTPILISQRDRAKRKQRRSKQMFGASLVVVVLPIFEFIGRHNSFTDLTTPSAVAHLGTLCVGSWGMYQSMKLRHEAAAEEDELDTGDNE